MEGVKSHVMKMIHLVSGFERRKNHEVERAIFRIERLLLWINESIDADTKSKTINGRSKNGK